MTTRASLVAAAALLAMTVPAGAAQHNAVRKSDQQFLQDAASGGLMEVELGQIAEKNASSDRVKEFGQRMVKDHGVANDELKQLAEQQSVKIPTKPTGEHAKTIDRLSKLHGAQFDRAYMQTMLADHRKDVDKFRKESKSGENGDVKAFAAKTLPTLESHLQMAEDIAGAKGSATSGTSTHRK
jgi:putative membrane protein